MRRLGIAMVALAALAGWPALAQDKGAQGQKPAEQMMPQVQPTPQHARLKQLLGTWDATVEFSPAPGEPPQVSKGTEVVRECCGGLWVVTDFTSDMGGMPFVGHGVGGYDPDKKKYVGTWVDSMTTSLSVSEGTYDEAKKAYTSWMEAKTPDGQTVRTKVVEESPDANTRIAHFLMPGADGKDVETMKITYKRVKKSGP
ncbi:MAG: DUF1579 domain-containing protein [Acidobacteria bacterium]|nr:DUF1579 domain-containing protein [Acidobacteriota bacterium]